MKRIKILFFAALCVVIFGSAIIKKKEADKLARDYVPDEKTAISIAEAVWLPVFGKSIYECEPFVATLTNNVWLVQGTFNIPETTGDTVIFKKGGVPYIKIQKTDGKILSVYRTK